MLKMDLGEWKILICVLSSFILPKHLSISAKMTYSEKSQNP